MMHERRLVRCGTVAVLVAISAACGLPVRAAERPDAAIEHGKDLIAAGQYQRAERELRWAMEHLNTVRDQRYFSAAANLAVALYRQGQFAKAESAYRLALAVRNR